MLESNFLRPVHNQQKNKRYCGSDDKKTNKPK